MRQALQKQKLPSSGAETAPKHETRYAVYVFHHKAHRRSGNDWERVLMTSSRVEALRKAEFLNQGGNYSRVEVKKRVYQPKSQRSLSLTVKLYETGKPSSFHWRSILQRVKMFLVKN